MKKLGLAWFLLAAASSSPAFAEDAATIASRGTAAITFADVDARMARVPEKDRASALDSPERIEVILSDMLLVRQIAEEARKAGLDRDPEVALEIAQAAEGVLARRRLAQIGAEAKIDTAALAREVYVSDRKSFTIPEQRKVRHILIRTENRTKEEARALAEKLLADARKPGADFGALATAHSEDETTQKTAGLLNEFGPGMMQDEFEKAAYALTKPGEVSDVVETVYGFHLIQLVGVTPAKPRAFEEVRGEIEARLATEHRKRATQEYADTLRNLPTEADPEAIASLRTRYYEQGDAAPDGTQEALAPESTDTEAKVPEAPGT